MMLTIDIRSDEDSRGWSDLSLQIGNGTPYPSKLIEDEEYI